jgi:hypothetical protein
VNQAHRTFALAAAFGELTGRDVDQELLFAAALLRDVGLTTTIDDLEVAVASGLAASDVAEEVGLSTAATDILLGAVTLHRGSGVTHARGDVAYLLSAGVALDFALAAAFRG